MTDARRWLEAALKILRHDLVLVALVVSFVVVSVGVLSAANRVDAPDGRPIEAEPLAEVAAGPLDSPEESAPAPAPAPSSELIVTRGEIRKGDTLASSLRRQGVSLDVLEAIVRELRPLYDFRLAQPGHTYHLNRSSAGELVDFRYSTSLLESYRVIRFHDGYHVAVEQAPLRSETAHIAGVVTSTLHEAVVRLGESQQLAGDFADIFAWDIDFSRSARYGDEFSALYQRLYYTDDDGEDRYVGPGRILAARYQGADGNHTAIYFEPEEGRGGYYRPDGSSVERSFLMAPLRYSRISSAYTHARRHPILRVTRPHHGIDYAAPEGTPIWSVSDGEVIYRGSAGGFGNLVKVRHDGGYVSYYAHLSRFAKGLRVGQKIRQKQMLGYVGQTGLATGPHVCFRVAKDGRYINPELLHSPTGHPPILSQQLAQFEDARDVFVGQLDAGPVLVATEEAL